MKITLKAGKRWSFPALCDDICGWSSTTVTTIKVNGGIHIFFCAANYICYIMYKLLQSLRV